MNAANNLILRPSSRNSALTGPSYLPKYSATILSLRNLSVVSLFPYPVFNLEGGQLQQLISFFSFSNNSLHVIRQVCREFHLLAARWVPWTAPVNIRTALISLNSPLLMNELDQVLWLFSNWSWLH